MKKTYIEPVMIVEDFTVSEMVAGNCGIAVNKLNVVQYANGYESCDIGNEPYWKENLPGGTSWDPLPRSTMYANFTDLYNGTSDFVADGNSTDTDYLFTNTYHQHTIDKGSDASNICSTDPIQYGITFGNMGPIVYDCTSDSSLLQNS